MLIEKCKICGSIAIIINKDVCGGHGYFVYCMDCHTRTKTKPTKHGAWKAWNKYMRDVDCMNCRKWGTQECPNSSLCYDSVIKPYFERKDKK